MEKLTCPYCGHKFDWEPPDPTTIYKLGTARSATQQKQTERYIVTCPKCKEKFDVYA